LDDGIAPVNTIGFVRLPLTESLSVSIRTRKYISQPTGKTSFDQNYRT
jgi:hypothetical protein